jgi:hypothetical protein
VIPTRIAPSLPASPLWRALSASALVHAGVAAVLVAGSPLVPSARLVAASPLQATLSEARPAALSPIEAAPLKTVAFSRIRESRLPQLAQLPRGDDPADATPASARHAPSGPVAAIAEVLADHGRLGALLTRELAQFPTEIDSPVRIAEPIVVPLPAEAIAGAGDSSIVVWAIVMADGSVDTALLADGDESLAEPILAAVKAARFIPAVSRLQPRDYPISLEFRFAPNDPVDSPERVVSASAR